VAENLLQQPESIAGLFVKVMPKEYKKALARLANEGE